MKTLSFIIFFTLITPISHAFASDDNTRSPFLTCYFKGQSDSIKEIAFMKGEDNSGKAVAVAIRDTTLLEPTDNKVFMWTDISLSLNRNNQTVSLEGDLFYFNGSNPFKVELSLKKEQHKMDLISKKGVDCLLIAGHFTEEESEVTIVGPVVSE